MEGHNATTVRDMHVEIGPYQTPLIGELPRKHVSTVVEGWTEVGPQHVRFAQSDLERDIFGTPAESG
jgi:hypothetical protein